MRNMLHVFWKDSRFLRMPITLLLGWQVLFVYVHVAALGLEHLSRRETPLVAFLQWGPAIAWIAWTYVIAQVVHADGPRGESPFWVTRPIAWRGLMVAKFLFVAVYVALPLALAQAAVVALVGLPLGKHLLGLVMTQSAWMAGAFVPIAAVAALTRTLPQFVLVSVSLFLVTSVIPILAVEFGPLTWIVTSLKVLIAGIAGTIVMWLQYRRHRTQSAILVALGGILLLHGAPAAMSWDRAWSLQRSLSGLDQLVLNGSLEAPDARPPQGVVLSPLQFRFPFSIHGLPAGTLIACDAVDVALQLENGRRVREAPDRRPRIMGMRRATAVEAGCTGFLLKPDDGESAFDLPATVEATVYVTVFDEPRWTELPIDGAAVMVPEAGRCAAVQQRTTLTGSDRRLVDVHCDMAMRRPRVLVEFADSPDGQVVTAAYPDYSVWPGGQLLLPVTRTAVNDVGSSGDAWVATRRIRSHVQIHVRREHVDLSNYNYVAKQAR